MNYDNLGKRLWKEFNRNKKKTAVLGVLTLVAFYFWVPLVWKWIGGSPSTDAVATPLTIETQPTAPTTNQTQTTAPSNAVQQPSVPWEQLTEWIKADPLMSTATLAGNQRNPFQPLVAVAQQDVAAQGDAAAEGNTMPVASPEQLGLVLSTTWIGPGGSLARINGTMYRLDDVVSVSSGTATSDEGQAPQLNLRKPVGFQLAEIHPRHVVLQSGKERFDLHVRGPELATGNQIIFIEPAPPRQ